MIENIICALLIPHAVVFLVLFKIATWQVRVDDHATFRDSMRLLWRWMRPYCQEAAADPRYWAASAVVSAFFLAGTLKGVL